MEAKSESFENSKMNAKLKLITHKGPMELNWIETHAFIIQLSTSNDYIPGKNDEEFTVRFTKMNSRQRSSLHSLAEKEKLSHISRGEGEERVLVISRIPPDSDASAKKEKRSRRGGLPIGISEIIEGFLYLGSARDTRCFDILEGCNITRIVNCAKEWHALPGTGHEHHYTMWEDVNHQVIVPDFQTAFEFIEKAKENNHSVLVHCMVGKSRSASLVIAYLVKYNGMDLKTAFEHVRSKRSLIRPNEGFMKQLLKFEEEHLGKNSITLEEYKQYFSGENVKWESVRFAETNEEFEKARKEKQILVDSVVDQFINEEILTERFEQLFKGEELTKEKRIQFILAVMDPIKKDAKFQSAINELVNVSKGDIFKSINNRSSNYYEQKLTPKESAQS
eukprot:TRINITY_DN6001_c0_g1_i2.p1 TRINITY_DN6001_c0_g1~~TRINITY_DN6001_c0_g1_i2.p1  ORF type:complete len:392 (+),score=128.62 TRINITY_DN6001_c0_g1_i2:202-1377(+)